MQRAADFNEADPKAIFGFVIVEGLHCFFGDQSLPNSKDIFKNNFESFTDSNTVLVSMYATCSRILFAIMLLVSGLSTRLIFFLREMA